MYKRVAVKALRGALIKDKNEGILISSHINQRYFSGLDYTDGYVLILAEKAYLLADFRYIEVARATVDAEVFEVVMPEGRMLTELGVLCAAEGVTKLYVEEETVSLADNGRLADAIGGVEIVGGASAEIEKLRAIKSQAELDKIAAAQKITDAAFEHILGFITPERTEKEVALELEFFMRSHGADGIAFETIAVSGSASSMPHGVPRDVKLERGFLTMDFGAFLDGYCSDMTRTVVIGKADADVRRVYETVLAAQTAALEYIAEGRECASVDKVARDLIYGAGYEGCFGHGLGHGVGMLVHEAPRVSSAAPAGLMLQRGHVVTVEPGIYLAGKYGCRIENMVAIDLDGKLLNFTKSPKQLIEI